MCWVVRPTMFPSGTADFRAFGPAEASNTSELANRSSGERPWHRKRVGGHRRCGIIPRSREHRSDEFAQPVTGSALHIAAEPATRWQCLLGALRAPRTAMRTRRNGYKLRFLEFTCRHLISMETRKARENLLMRVQARLKAERRRGDAATSATFKVQTSK